MEISCIATGSSGNCYLVKLGGSTIILDAGIAIGRISSAVNLNNVAFAFISHSHNDHCQSALNLKKKGVQVVYGNSYPTFTKISNTLEFGGNLEAWVFPVQHDKTVPCGGIIIRYQNECLIYAIDFIKCEYDLSIFKPTAVMVECNYSKDLLENADVYTQRQLATHMDIVGCSLFLKTLDLSKCEQIVLMHNSDRFGDPVLAGVLISREFGIKTNVCKKNGGMDEYGQ